MCHTWTCANCVGQSGAWCQEGAFCASSPHMHRFQTIRVHDAVMPRAVVLYIKAFTDLMLLICWLVLIALLEEGCWIIEAQRQLLQGKELVLCSLKFELTDTVAMKSIFLCSEIHNLHDEVRDIARNMQNQMSHSTARLLSSVVNYSTCLPFSRN